MLHSMSTKGLRHCRILMASSWLQAWLNDFSTLQIMSKAASDMLVPFFNEIFMVLQKEIFNLYT